MLHIVIDGTSHSVETVSEYAYRIKVTAGAVATWFKKCTDAGGVIDSAYQVGNMKFFRTSDLDVLRNTYQREAKPKQEKQRKTVPMMDYLHLEALLENEKRWADQMMQRALKAEAYAESIISG